jgi:D-sedoheptulose 7-phosphate isomerase
MTGSNVREVEKSSDLVISVPSSDTPLIQQVHITLAHIICGLVEHEMFKVDATVCA